MSAIYSEAFVAAVAKELADARTAVYVNSSGLDVAGAVGKSVASMDRDGKLAVKRLRRGISKEEAEGGCSTGGL